MLLKCQFCGYIDSSNSGDFQMDHDKGFFCEICDGYTYLIQQQHKFTLILEDKNKKEVFTKQRERKFMKRLSPYRYPGGKSKIIDYLFLHIERNKTKKLVSPFTGGGSFELALLESGEIEELHINDIDTGVFSLWWCIKYMPYALIYRLNSSRPTHKDFFKAQSIILKDYKGVDMVEAAWSSLLVNRLAFSGLVKANPLGGRHGHSSQLLSRWNVPNLIKRIEIIHSLSDRIEVTQTDGIELIEECYWQEDTTIFIDPPYVEKGEQLYHCYFEKQEHIKLAFLLDSLFRGCPGADIIAVYDYNQWLECLYDHPVVEYIGRTYSV